MLLLASDAKFFGSCFSDVPSNHSLSKPETIQRSNGHLHLCKYAVNLAMASLFTTVCTHI